MYCTAVESWVEGKEKIEERRASLAQPECITYGCHRYSRRARHKTIQVSLEERRGSTEVMALADLDARRRVPNRCIMQLDRPSGHTSHGLGSNVCRHVATPGAPGLSSCSLRDLFFLRI